MLIRELVNKYVELGHSFKNAQNLAAEEIMLTKIASSPLSDHVTLKGGIVMYNLSKNNRRVTKDIDFDFIRYSINEDSIYIFVNKLNSTNDKIHCKVLGKPEPLHHEEYKGIRINLLLEDTKKDKLKIKLDIGVHTHLLIEQPELLFTFESGGNSVVIKANSPEQIFVEKLISLGRLGILSTRYKDIYDMHYLLSNDLLNKEEVFNLVNEFLSKSNRKPKTLKELLDLIVASLSDTNFSKEASRPVFKWVDKSYEEIRSELFDYIYSIFEKN